MVGNSIGWAGRGRRAWRQPGLEKLEAGLAIAAVVAVLGAQVLVEVRSDHVAAETKAADDDKGIGDADERTAATRIGAYIGVPYTHASDVRIRNAGGTDLTIRSVDWVGRPFNHPIYYGLRVLRWREASPLGAMLDFTHSKAIARKTDVLDMEGSLNGKAMPAKAKVGETFRHFEFSHGHNALAANGLLRLARIAGRFRPYLGAGAGISIPHTEIQFLRDPVRTYMYQYAGPMAQGLVGLEVDLGRTTVFLEYKLTFAPYLAPLMHQTTEWAVLDFVAQVRRWWSGRAPEGGWLETRLLSHQVVAGATWRVGAPPRH